MNKSFWQQAKPHVLAIGIFLIVSILYNLPAFQGMILNQHDTLGWRGVAQQSFEFKEKHGHFPLWSNSLFSGMPAYQVALETTSKIGLGYLQSIFTLFLPAPASYFFMACLGLYILCMVVGTRTWPAIFGGIAYGFASYNAVIAVVGHNTKFAAMGYAPAVLAGFILLTQRKYILGFISTLIFTTLLVWQNHLQITYYTFLIIGIIALFFLIKQIREKALQPVLKVAGLSIVSLVLAVAYNAVTLIPTNSFAKESMRGGGSQLTIGVNGEKIENDKNKTKGGLNKDYAFHWSYGISETLTFALPAFKGGSSGPSELPENGKALEALQNAQLPGEVINYFYSSLSAYWGTQPGTSATVYLGAIVCLLVVAGMFVVSSWHKGWIVAASVLGIVLAWGSNFAAVNYFLFDHLPFYNKFRAPTTSLVIPQLTFALFAAMALQALFYQEWDKAVLMKKLKQAGIAVAALAVLLIGTYFMADFKSSTDKDVRQGFTGILTQMMGGGQQQGDAVAQQANTVVGSIMTGLVEDRKSIYGSDLIRTLVFMALAAFLIWYGVNNKKNALYILIIFSVLNLIDLLQVDHRYLKNENYIAKDEFLQPLEPNRADLQIKQDTGYFRVFDQSVNSPFTDARASYHHNSVGGYLPARLSLYDDLITHQLNKGNMDVFNMLNTKYFISMNQQDRQPYAQPNPGALGAAWLVKNIKYVSSADEEMMALNNFNPADTVIIDAREKAKVSFEPQFDSLASVKLVKNENDLITYDFNAPANQFVVFSEVYYPNGWKAFIDGKETPIVKVNYALRGLPVSAGKHSIEFKFEPESYITGNRITTITGIISVLLVLGGAFLLWKQRSKSNVNTTA